MHIVYINGLYRCIVKWSTKYWLRETLTFWRRHLYSTSNVDIFPSSLQRIGAKIKTYQDISHPLLIKLFLKLALWVPDHQDCRKQSDVWLLAFRAKVSHSCTLTAFQVPPPHCFLLYLSIVFHSFSLLWPAEGKLRKERWSRVSKTKLAHHRTSCSTRFPNPKEKHPGALRSCYSRFHHYVLYVYIYVVTIRPMHPGTSSCHPKLCLRPSGKTLGVTKKCRSCPSTISCGGQNMFAYMFNYSYTNYGGMQIELACNMNVYLSTCTKIAQKKSCPLGL